MKTAAAPDFDRCSPCGLPGYKHVHLDADEGNYNRAIYRRKEENMKLFTTIAAVIFAVIALVHIVRLFLGWEVTVSGMAIPMWASVAGLVIAAGLAVMLLREARK